jgi:glycosyltransferase involved in cell wall biosynthesis
MNPGGVETWLLHTMRYIDPDRIQFHFCTFGPEPGLYAPEIEKLGGTILRCAKDENPFSLGRRFRQILRTGKYDAVHSHVTLFSGAVLRWAKAEGVSIRFAHSHNTHDDKPSTFARLLYRRLMKSWIHRYATHGLAASRPAAAALFGEHWEADGRFRVLYYGVDLHPFQEPSAREQVRRELGIPVDAPVVGHVGRFEAQKNHQFLLEIVGESLKRRPDIHFLLVGVGPLRSQIEARAEALGILANVHFTGIRTDVPRLMCDAMDFFLFPSLFEGLGLSLVEAQAAGLNCLASDAVPNEAAILPDLVEFLPLSTGARFWTTRLIERIDAPRVKLTLALNAVDQSRFSIRRSAQELTAAYMSALAFAGPQFSQQREYHQTSKSDE